MSEECPNIAGRHMYASMVEVSMLHSGYIISSIH